MSKLPFELGLGPIYSWKASESENKLKVMAKSVFTPDALFRPSTQQTTKRIANVRIYVERVKKKTERFSYY